MSTRDNGLLSLAWTWGHSELLFRGVKQSQVTLIAITYQLRFPIIDTY